MKFTQIVNTVTTSLKILSGSQREPPAFHNLALLIGEAEGGTVGKILMISGDDKRLKPGVPSELQD